MHEPHTPSRSRSQRLAERFAEVRRESLELAAPLSSEEWVVQSMPDASPTKWHLAHTTWFFETFVLPGDPVDPAYSYLFNSYYEAVGDRHPRDVRGLITRPNADEVVAYRVKIDEAVLDLLDLGTADNDVLDLIELGIHHEQQHQELLLMDALHLLAQHPFSPSYTTAPVVQSASHPGGWSGYAEAIIEIGNDGDAFIFDNEGPRHRSLLPAFEIFDAPVTCGQFQEFIDDGGYDQATLWLSDGWGTVKRDGWSRPIYWRPDGSIFNLHGLQQIDPNQPVSHISYYEADAFARWAGHRLPTEFEWERAFGSDDPADAQVRSGEVFHPVGPAADATGSLGSVWEWTSSAYSAYPGFRTAPGAVGEYNGKFMANQYVLRGGGYLTPVGHVRTTYRNFFHPHTRWHTGGVRLARDL